MRRLGIWESMIANTWAAVSAAAIQTSIFRYPLTDALIGKIGYLFIAGRTSSVGGQYDRHGEGWARLEYRI